MVSEGDAGFGSANGCSEFKLSPTWKCHRVYDIMECVVDSVLVEGVWGAPPRTGTRKGTESWLFLDFDVAPSEGFEPDVVL